MPRRKLEDYPRELVGRRVALQWEAGGVMEAFVVSYNEQTGEISVGVGEAGFSLVLFLFGLFVLLVRVLLPPLPLLLLLLLLIQLRLLLLLITVRLLLWRGMHRLRVS